MTEEKKRDDRLQNFIDIQKEPGNAHFNPYLLGMCNGLIFADSVINDEEPEYVDAPEHWLEPVPTEYPAWNPDINTAPKDGTYILAFAEEALIPAVVYWHSDAECFCTCEADDGAWENDFAPAQRDNMRIFSERLTHWMFLPKVPA